MVGGGRLAISSPLAPALTRSGGGDFALMGWVNARAMNALRQTVAGMHLPAGLHTLGLSFESQRHEKQRAEVGLAIMERLQVPGARARPTTALGRAARHARLRQGRPLLRVAER
jgi:hypothetical protein